MANPPLSQAVGYGIVLGLGFLFAFGMMTTTYVLKRYFEVFLCILLVSFTQNACNRLPGLTIHYSSTMSAPQNFIPCERLLDFVSGCTL